MTADIAQIPVPVGTAVQAWAGVENSTEQILFWNQDITNTITLGFNPQIAANGFNTIPVPPNGSFQLPANRTVYVIGASSGIQPLVVIPNAGSMFRALTQGLGALAIPSIFSPNYIAGVSGWSIKKDGSAEFNNLTIRGTFFGVNFILNSVGMFFYTPTEALGNLSVSITPNGGTGPFGETVEAGVIDYSLTPGLPFAAQLNQGQLNIKDYGTSPGGRLLQVRRDGLFSSDAGPGVPFGITLSDSGLAGDSTFNATALIKADSTSGGTLSSIDFIADNLQTDHKSGWSAKVSSAIAAAAGATAINPSAFTNLSPSISIPANDGKIGTVYRLTAGGKFTFGATLQVLSFQLFGTGIIVPIGTAEFVVNNTYSWKATGEFAITAGPLNAATVSGTLNVSIGSDAGNEATVAASTQTAGDFTQSAQITLDMTTARNLAIQVKFAAASAGNSITCYYGYPERLGP